mmetsp:Transcript_92493/g.160674  ORF Transcript_92493/g.160674 Transcript_92493/m.160674 type:complete len:326 (-) Transcript_92493:19-996(-)
MWTAMMGVPHLPGFSGVRHLHDQHELLTAFTRADPEGGMSLEAEREMSNRLGLEKIEKTNRKGRFGPNGGMGPKKLGPNDIPVPFVEQVGDSIGFGEGKNWIVSTGIKKKEYWCKNPDKPDEPGPFAENYHPSITLAYNARQIHVTLKDLGDPDADEEEEPDILWDAEFAEKSTKEVHPTMIPYEGEQMKMKPICPGKQKAHRLEMNVTGVDHRAKPPKDRDRSFDETVMFDAEWLPPGKTPHHRAYAGEPDDGKEQRAAWSPCSPDMAALLLPPPAVNADVGTSASAGQRAQRTRKRNLEAAIFLSVANPQVVMTCKSQSVPCF